MRTLRLTIEYDGTDLCGWQSQAGQPNQPTVQETLEAALSSVLNEPVKVHGAGRTDAGVHARGQVAHFQTDNPLPEHNLLRGVNTELRRDIAVREVREVPSHFDAQRSAISRHYRYLIWNHRAPSPLRARTTCHVPWELDNAAMCDAARRMEGDHDFSAFRSSACTAERTQRTVDVCRLFRDGSLAVFDVISRAFLHSQVRIMAGTLLEVGKGRLKPEDIDRIFASGDRNQAGPTAPANGLILWSVTYPQGM